jgi:hypothetical protein
MANFKTCIVLLIFSFFKILSASAQESSKVRVSNFIIKKGNQGPMVYDDSRIIGLVSIQGGKNILQINDEKIGEFSFVKYDENCQMIQGGSFLLPDVDVNKNFTRIKSISVNGEFVYMYYESHDKKQNSFSYLQKFSSQIEPVGKRILLSVEETGNGFMTDRFGYPLSSYNIFYSNDKTKICIAKSGNTGKVKNKMFSDKYTVHDFTTGITENYYNNFFVDKGFQKDLNISVGDDGNVYIFYKISNSEEEDKGFRYAFKSIGKNVDSSELKIPFNDIWLKNSIIRVEGKTLIISATYKKRNNKFKPIYAPKYIEGIVLSKFDLVSRTEIQNNRLLFINIFKDYKIFNFDKDELNQYSYGFENANFSSNGSIDFVLVGSKYVLQDGAKFGYNNSFQSEEEVEKRGYLPIILRFSPKFELLHHSVLNISPCGENNYSTTGEFLMLPNGNEFSLVTLSDTTNSDFLNTKKMICWGSDKKIKLTTFKFTGSGEVLRTFDAPFEIRKKMYIDLKKPVCLAKESGTFYFFSKNWKGYAKDYVLTSYKVQ